MAMLGTLRTAFPLGKTGGLIEAQRVVEGLLGGTWQFPLGKTGGLIEAMT